MRFLTLLDVIIVVLHSAKAIVSGHNGVWICWGKKFHLPVDCCCCCGWWCLYNFLSVVSVLCLTVLES